MCACLFIYIRFLALNRRHKPFLALLGYRSLIPIFLLIDVLVACENIRFSSLFAAGDVSRGGTSASQRQKFHTDDVNLSGIRSEALIGRRSSYIVLAIVNE